MAPGQPIAQTGKPHSTTKLTTLHANHVNTDREAPPPSLSLLSLSRAHSPARAFLIALWLECFKGY